MPTPPEATPPLPRLADGAAALGVALDAAQLALFARYAELLREANARVNLIAAGDLPVLETRHFLDSLTAAASLPVATLDGGRVVDIGAGAGLPGLALKVAFPGIGLDLVEATGKKAAFLLEAVDALGLTGVTVHNARAETLAHDPALREAFDAALARGVARMPALAELALPFLRVGGVLAAHKTASAAEEIAHAAGAIAVLGGSPAREIAVAAPGLDANRVLAVVVKARPTPAGYPRRPGVPAKSPLGG